MPSIFEAPAGIRTVVKGPQRCAECDQYNSYVIYSGVPRNHYAVIQGEVCRLVDQTSDFQGGCECTQTCTRAWVTDKVKYDIAHILAGVKKDEHATSDSDSN
jgi:hypothetical protein